MRLTQPFFICDLRTLNEVYLLIQNGKISLTRYVFGICIQATLSNGAVTICLECL